MVRVSILPPAQRHAAHGCVTAASHRSTRRCGALRCVKESRRAGHLRDLLKRPFLGGVHQRLAEHLLKHLPAVAPLKPLKPPSRPRRISHRTAPHRCRVLVCVMHRTGARHFVLLHGLVGEDGLARPQPLGARLFDEPAPSESHGSHYSLGRRWPVLSRRPRGFGRMTTTPRTVAASLAVTRLVFGAWRAFRLSLLRSRALKPAPTSCGGVPLR